jgi:UDP-2,4-diacetamido-2,4,6-trideoxy-beta-L-altropyranose hydrolase
MTHIAFLTEGGPEVGLGHVSRCLAVGRAADGARLSAVTNEDAQVAALLGALPACVMSRPWPADPASALERLRELAPDVIVVDSYAASSELLLSLRSVAPVVVIDDLADRRLPVDVVVNGGAGAERLPYERAPGTLFLLGPSYALLDTCYAERPARRAGSDVERIFVCLGGGRHVEGLVTALEAVDRVFSGCLVDVAAGPFSAGSPSLDRAAGTGGNRIRIHRGSFGLRALMLAADVAISGSGVTLCELAATATPTAAVRMAGNQRPNVEAFVEAGAALPAGEVSAPDLGEAIERALRQLAGDRALRARMGERGRALVDGRGAERVARAIMRPVEFAR